MYNLDNGKTVAGEILSMAMLMIDESNPEEFHKYATETLNKILAVGAGLGGGFNKITELRVMK